MSCRKTPDLAFSEAWNFIESEITTPAVAVSPDKRVFTSVRKAAPRAVHTAMMQVMGGAFSGHNPKWRQMERNVVESLLTESNRYREKPGKSREYNSKHLREAAARIVSVIKQALESEVAVYLRHFSARLSAPEVNLKLGTLNVMNNCQTFCKSLMHGPDKLFETILPKTRPLDIVDNTTPRYLLSFASDQFGAMYDSEAFHTTPSATYLAEFHTGEDIVEYFDTWPHIPRENDCAKLLCWPCLNEGRCSIAQHMWHMPHETTSLIEFHILRDRTNYRHPYKTTDPKEDGPSLLTDLEWFQNRLRVLIALDTFLTSAGALVASYQMIAEESADGESLKPWRPDSVAEVGALILPGDEKDGTQNFTIQNVGRPILPLWFSKDRNLEKHLAKTTSKRWASGPSITGAVEKNA